MQVRVTRGMDFEGQKRFDWEASDGAGGVDVPKNTLDRLTAEREAFEVAYLRYKRTLDEIDELLCRAEDARARGEARQGAAAMPLARPSSTASSTAQSLAVAVAESKSKYR